MRISKLCKSNIYNHLPKEKKNTILPIEPLKIVKKKKKKEKMQTNKINMGLNCKWTRVD